MAGHSACRSSRELYSRCGWALWASSEPSRSITRLSACCVGSRPLCTKHWEATGAERDSRPRRGVERAAIVRVAAQLSRGLVVQRATLRPTAAATRSRVRVSCFSGLRRPGHGIVVWDSLLSRGTIPNCSGVSLFCLFVCVLVIWIFKVKNARPSPLQGTGRARGAHLTCRRGAPAPSKSFKSLSPFCYLCWAVCGHDAK